MPDPYPEEILKKIRIGLSGGKLKKFWKIHELNVRI